MLRKKSKRRFVETKRSAARKKQTLLPRTFTESSWVALLRIIAAAILFAGLAIWGLAKMQHFSEKFILSREIARFRSEITSAQVFAVQNRRTVRLVLSEIEKNHVYRFEKLARGKKYYRGIPLDNEDYAFGKDPRNWSLIKPPKHISLSSIDVSVGSLSTLYMFPDSSCANGWPKPFLLHGTTKMKTEAVRFSLGEANDTLFFSDNGLMPVN